MTKELLIAFGLIAVIPLVPVSADAQGAPQTIAKYKVDVTNVSTGYRGSKLVGAAVVNEANEKIGTVDDLIVTRSDKVVYAIVSVGGFLGVGDKLVAVPFDGFQLAPDKTTLPGATKEALMNMPKFTYQK
jgi:sporulation protein YlmC with PRC-barrel domain